MCFHLIEKAQQSIDEEEAKEIGSRMMSQEFNLEDFLAINATDEKTWTF